MMKRLLFMLAFLVSFGFAAVGQESIDPSNEESSNNTEQNETTPQGPLEKSVNLSTEGVSLADALGDDVAKVTKLIVSGTLTNADFETIKNDMRMLQVLDMQGVTALPIVSTMNFDSNTHQYISYPGIPKYQFNGDNRLTLKEVIMPSCVEYIGLEAFNNCEYLSKVDFSHAENLKIIGGRCFDGCKISSLDLSNCINLERIEYNAFSNCSQLTNVDLSGCSNLQLIDNSTFQDCEVLSTINFSNCTSLKILETDVFWRCRSLSSVVLTDNIPLEKIGSGSFRFCEQLSSFDFCKLSQLKIIGSEAFYFSGLQGDISFASPLEQLGERAFAYTPITSIDLSNSTFTVFPAEAFVDCRELKTINLSGCNSLVTMNTTAFSNCLSLKQVIINNGFFKSEEDVLYSDDMTELLLYPSGKEQISFEIPSGIKTIHTSAFPYNPTLKEVTIPLSVETINPDAFGYYETSDFFGNFSGKIFMKSPTPIRLTRDIGLRDATIYLPNEEALSSYKQADIWKDYKLVKAGASDLVEINLDGSQSLSVVLANEGIDLDMISQLKITGTVKASDFEALRQMNNLTQLDLGDVALENNEVPNKAFSSNSILLENIILPTTTKSIGSYAFMFCNNLKHINLSDLSALEYIGFEAFWSCSNLIGSLILPESIKNIEAEAFGYTGFTSVDLSKTQLTVVNSALFKNCSLTGSIVFPESITCINSYAFDKAEFTSITLKSPETYLNNDNFTQTNKSVLVFRSVEQPKTIRNTQT